MTEIPPRPRRGDVISAEWGAGVIDCLTSRDWENLVNINQQDWRSEPIEIPLNRNLYDMFFAIFFGNVLPPQGSDGVLRLKWEGDDERTMILKGSRWTSEGVSYFITSTPAFGIAGSLLQSQTVCFTQVLIYPYGWGWGKLYLAGGSPLQEVGLDALIQYEFLTPRPSRCWVETIPEGTSWLGLLRIWGRRM